MESDEEKCAEMKLDNSKDMIANYATQLGIQF